MVYNSKMEVCFDKPKIARLGILGGSFNPVHNAHIMMAECAARALMLDRVLFMTANDPPHKEVDGHIPAELRHRMAELAAGEVSNACASDMELKRSGKSYTIDTVLQLKRDFPGAEIFLVIGGDMLHTLSTWHRAGELMHEASFAVFSRDDYSEEADARRYREEYRARIQLLPERVPAISSTDIRARIYDALPISHMVPYSVEAFLYENGLYQPDDIRRLQEICKRDLRPRRYVHTMGVVRSSIALAYQYGADPKKARLAALLHDYGKSIDQDALRHAPLGEKLAREKLMIRDEEVLSAIRYHTTLKDGASKLEKIVYLADLIEPHRTIPRVDEIRALAGRDLDAAVLAGLNRTIEYLSEKNLPIQHCSIAARDELLHSLHSRGMGTDGLPLTSGANPPQI